VLLIEGSPLKTFRKKLSLLLTVFISSGLLSSISYSAHADTGAIYWVNQTTPSNNIGKAALDGTGVNEDLITGIANNGGYDGGISVQGSYVYWSSGPNVLRSKKDGSGTPQVLETATAGVYSVATDSQYLYWDYDGVSGHGAIGRSLLDGSSANPAFISNTSVVATGNDNYGIAVTSSYIYWADYTSNTIGRANIDGTGINNHFITVPTSLTLLGGPCGVYVQGSYIYWASYDGNAIGRANIDGSGINATYLSTGAGSSPYYVVTDSQYIYWTNTGSPISIGRAKLDGTSRIDNFIPISTGMPIGIWVDGAAPAIVPVAPIPVPDPLQLSKITSISSDTSTAQTSSVVSINGAFVEKISNIEIDGKFLPAAAWIQSPTSITFTLPVKSAGVYRIQLYNGSAPVLPTQTFTVMAPPVKPPVVALPKVKVTYIRCSRPGHGIRITYGINPVCAAGSHKL
jgi:hypothetical protein